MNVAQRVVSRFKAATSLEPLLKPLVPLVERDDEDFDAELHAEEMLQKLTETFGDLLRSAFKEDGFITAALAAEFKASRRTKYSDGQQNSEDLSYYFTLTYNESVTAKGDLNITLNTQKLLEDACKKVGLKPDPKEIGAVDLLGYVTSELGTKVGDIASDLERGDLQASTYRLTSQLDEKVAEVVDASLEQRMEAWADGAEKEADLAEYPMVTPEWSVGGMKIKLGKTQSGSQGFKIPFEIQWGVKLKDWALHHV